VPVTFETVRQLALALPGVEEGTSYGTPAWKVKGKLFARQHQDGESLVISVDFDQREMLMAEQPETFYITDHYLNYPWMLVRLAKVRAPTNSQIYSGRRGGVRRPAVWWRLLMASPLIDVSLWLSWKQNALSCGCSAKVMRKLTRRFALTLR